MSFGRFAWIAAVVAAISAAMPVRAQSPNPVVVIQTSMGAITVELYKDKAPKSVENFLAYVKDGYYRGTIFHRVIKGFNIFLFSFIFGFNFKRLSTK